MAIMMQYFVPLVPDGAPVVVNVNQYDYDDPNYAGRLIFNMIYQGTSYDLTGATASIQGTKPDGKVFAYDAIVSGSSVRVRLTQQMTAVYGRTVCSVIVLDADNNRIGSFNVWLEVQESALDGRAPASETEIPELIALATEQAAAAQQSATSAASSASQAAAWSANPPYIGLNGDWFVFNPTTGLYEDSGYYAVGRNGSMWYAGTAVSGKSATPTAYATGIDMAYVGDMYLNWNEGAIYECTTQGDPTTALWVYGMTLSGGGGGIPDYNDAQNKPKINGTTLQGDVSLASIGAAAISSVPITLTQLQDVDAENPQPGDVLAYDGTEWAPSAGGSGTGHEMKPTPGAGVDEAAIVAAVNTAKTQGGVNNQVGSLNTIGRWSDVTEKAYMFTATQANPLGPTGIGTLDESDPFADTSDWLYIADLAGVLSDDERQVTVVFDPATFTDATPILGAYAIDDEDCLIAIKFANEISAADQVTGSIGIKITKDRVAVSELNV